MTGAPATRLATDLNSGPGWYEVIHPRNATTRIAYVQENGDLYLPEGDDLTPEEFAFAAARGRAHRLVRADEAQQTTHVDRAAVLREAVEVAGQMGGRFGTDDHGDVDAGWNDACEAIATELRTLAEAAAVVQPPTEGDTKTLAAALAGLGTLIATSSRDWGTYRVDAWLYAVLVGWDCKQDVHDETCTHGAMEEMQQTHGWDDAAVAKARRYRAAVHALTTPAVPEERP